MKLAPLGAPTRVTVTRVMRPTYRVEWEFDGLRMVGDAYDDPPEFEPDRRLKVETFFSKHAAYRWAAMRLIFSRRDKLATGRDGFKSTGCRLCAVQPYHPEEEPRCRYHGGDGFERLVERLTSFLKYRATSQTAGKGGDRG